MILGGTGFITVSVAGVAAVGGGMAGDARLPVTGSGATFEPTNRRVVINAVGTRSAVRRINVNVPNAVAGVRIELTSTTLATLQITLEGNRVLSAETGRGFVQFESLTPQRAVGRYEGTFQNGPTPMVVRGNFQVNLLPTTANTAAATAVDAGGARVDASAPRPSGWTDSGSTADARRR